MLKVMKKGSEQQVFTSLSIFPPWHCTGKPQLESNRSYSNQRNGMYNVALKQLISLYLLTLINGHYHDKKKKQ